MAKSERFREVLTAPLSTEYLREKERQGWRAVAVEWERAGERAPASGLVTEEVPYGLKIAEDHHHLVEDASELEALTLISPRSSHGRIHRPVLRGGSGETILGDRPSPPRWKRRNTPPRWKRRPSPPRWKSELLASDRMHELLSLLRSRFDFVLLDTPPVLPVADAVILGPHTDGLVVCARAGALLRDDAKICRDRLRYADLKIFGLVLNRYSQSTGGYSKRYRYYDPYEAAEEPAESTSAA